MHHRQFFVRAAVAAVALVAVGCSSSKDALEKRMATMQQELIAVQNENDRIAERLMALEVRQSQAASAARSSARESAEPSVETVERPPLKVVKLEPGAPAAGAPALPEPPAPEEADDEPRPLIRDIGSGKAKTRARAAERGPGQTGAGP